MPGDLVKCDVGVLTQGYNGDTSRTVMVGVSDPEVIRLVETTKKCLAAGIAAAGPGVHLGDVGYAIQKVAEDAGFGVVRDWIGHGVGRTVHEDPEVPNYGKPGTKLVLKPGMTIAIEPMITLTKAGAKTYVDRDNGWTVITGDHCMAAHWEHTVAITDDGCEILTLPADYPGCAKPRRSGSGALLGNHRSFIIDSTGMKFGEIHRCALRHYHLVTYWTNRLGKA